MDQEQTNDLKPISAEFIAGNAEVAIGANITTHIGILINLPNAESDRQKMFNRSFRNIIDFYYQRTTDPERATFMHIQSLCGKKFDIRAPPDFPLVDVPCSCGDPNHWFIKWEVQGPATP